MLGAAPGVGPFSLLVARPYSFLDVALDIQAIKILYKDHRTNQTINACLQKNMLSGSEWSQYDWWFRWELWVKKVNCIPPDFNITMHNLNHNHYSITFQGQRLW